MKKFLLEIVNELSTADGGSSSVRARIANRIVAQGLALDGSDLPNCALPAYWFAANNDCWHLGRDSFHLVAARAENVALSIAAAKREQPNTTIVSGAQLTKTAARLGEHGWRHAWHKFQEVKAQLVHCGFEGLGEELETAIREVHRLHGELPGVLARARLMAQAEQLGAEAAKSWSSAHGGADPWADAARRRDVVSWFREGWPEHAEEHGLPADDEVLIRSYLLGAGFHAA